MTRLHWQLLTLIYLLAASSPGLAAERTFIHAGHVMIQPDLPVLEQQTIIIQGTHIEAIRPGYLDGDHSAYGSVSVIDLSDYFIMAGLIDTHVHLTTSPDPQHAANPVTTTDADLVILAALHAERVLAAGFTTVMDLGTGRRDHEQAIYALRDAIHAGRVAGPEILASGSPLSLRGYSRTGRYRDQIETLIGPEAVCHGLESCRERVLEQLHRGADFINVYMTGSMLSEDSPAQTFSDAELEIIASTAGTLGRVVVADGGNDPASAAGLNAAIRAGITIIDTATFPDSETFALLNAKSGFFAPHVYALLAAVGDAPDTLRQGSMGWLPQPVLEKLFALKQMQPSAIAGYRTGARLLLASDSGVFAHGDNARELIAYKDIGISERDALMAATVNAAQAFGIFSRTGSLHPGKEADLIALPGNPLDDIEVVLDPRFIMSNGRILPSSQARH